MLRDRLPLTPGLKDAASKLADILLSEFGNFDEKKVVTITGESGTGKSGIAHEIARLIKEKGVKTVVIQQDDYFKVPPKTNYELRRKDISIVGIEEMDLELLNKHILKFKDPENGKIRKPLVIFDEDRIVEETIDCGAARLLIAEGTYASLLKGADKRIFLAGTYKDTLEDRLRRAREEIDDIDREILEIEHKVVSGHRELNDIVVEWDLSISIQDHDSE